MDGSVAQMSGFSQVNKAPILNTLITYSTKVENLLTFCVRKTTKLRFYKTLFSMSFTSKLECFHLENLVSLVEYWHVSANGTPPPGACIIKLITAVIYGFRNKLECLSVASLSSLV